MGRKPPRPWTCNACFVIGLICVLADGLAARSPRDDPPADSWKIDLSDNPAQLTKPQFALLLRPNIKQQLFYVYVTNPTKDDKKIVLEVIVKDSSGADQVVDGGKVEMTVAPGKPQRVFFPKAAAAPATVSGAAAPAAPAWPELPGPPWSFVITIKDADNDLKELARKTVRVNTLAAGQYVEVTSVNFTNAADSRTNSLVVKLKAKEDFPTAEPCPIRLVLSPDWITGLLESKKIGTYEGLLKPNKGTLELTAKNIKFKGDQPPDNGIVTLTVDQFDRAMMFETTFGVEGGSGRPDLIKEPGVHIRGDRYALPGKYKVKVEVDNPPDGEVFVEVSLGQGKGENFQANPDKVTTLTGARDQHVYFMPKGEDGGMSFKCAVQDRITEFDTEGLSGDFDLRVRLLKKVGNDLQEIKDERALVTIDKSAPEKIELGELPKSVAPGESFTINATGESKTGIRKVVFFLGKPNEDDKGEKTLPPKTPTIPAVYDEKNGRWVAKVEIPPDESKGKKALSVQFQNELGLSEFKTVFMEVGDMATAAGAATGEIHGTVVDGDRLQRGVVVTLLDPGNKTTDTAKTDENGEYLFKDVKPGAYFVYSENTVSNVKGSEKVTVVKGKRTEAEIKLFR